MFAKEAKSDSYNFRTKFNLCGFLFSQKKAIMEDTVDPNPFAQWLKQNHFHFSDYWKETEIPEIVEGEKLQEKVVLEKTK